MKFNVPAWRASLRLAIRSITRAKGRSALVALMVGVPVALSVIVATLYLTDDISAKEAIPSRMGTSQAVATFYGGTVEQDPVGQNYSDDGGGEGVTTEREVDAAQEQLARISGASIIPVRLTSVGITPSATVGVLQADFTRPATRGLVEVESGRLPAAAGEVVLGRYLADALHVSIGDSFALPAGTTLSVVGIGDGDIVTLPATQLPATRDLNVEFLLDRKAPIAWSDVRTLNKAGFLVESRYVIEHPSQAHWNSNRFSSSTDPAIARLIVIAVMIEIILLAGPAFAVGVRRQRRELALIAAAGGGPADVRRVVLAQAGVLGFGASVVGAMLGLALSTALVAFSRARSEAFAGPFEWSVPLTVLAVALGSLAAIAAAYAPARQVSRESLPTVLAGRRIEARSRAGLPIVGLVVVVMGMLVSLRSGTAGNDTTGVATGAILVVVGVVFLTPTLIRFLARSAPALPLPIRLALRDTARHTARSAPAIAAVMAVVAGVVALGIGVSSDAEANRQSYIYRQPVGVATISPGDDYAEVSARVATILPGRTLMPLPNLRSTDEWMVSIESKFPDGDLTPWYGTDDDRGYTTDIAIADAATLTAWGVRLTSDEAAALAAGKALVPTLRGTDPGPALSLVVYEGRGEASTHTARAVPVVKADLRVGDVPSGPAPILAMMVLSPETAKSLGLATMPGQVRISGTLTHDQENAIRSAFKADDNPLYSASYLDVERGYSSHDDNLAILLLAVAGALAVLVGTLSATGLALNDSRPDFATLTAIGAAPRTRRVLAAAQALTIGILGVLLGLGVGLLPGVLAARTATNFGPAGTVVVMPWLLFAVLMAAVPALAALVSGLFARGRTTTTRRLAG